MFEAQLLIDGTSRITKVYSPWYERRGDYLQYTAEFVAGAGTLEVEVYTKSEEETGDGSLVTGSQLQLSAGGLESKECTLLKELVRYEFTAGDASGEWVLLRIVGESWFDAVV